jgi:hypothetical protein
VYAVRRCPAVKAAVKRFDEAAKKTFEVVRIEASRSGIPT